MIRSLQVNVRLVYAMAAGEDDVEALERELRQLAAVSREQGLPIVEFFD